MNISKTYNGKEFEQKWYKYWLKNKYFKSIPDEREPYTIVIPPPNNTNNIHIGHALNNTYQDILIRAKRLQGYNTCWVPGTDSGGIATQNMVEKNLLSQNVNPNYLTDDKFLGLIQQWNRNKKSIIVQQLKKIGCACDWDRERFTMDKNMNKSVNETFRHLYNKNMIYQGNYMVNWCTRCKTAISDDEVEHKVNKSKLYYLRYPILENNFEKTRILDEKKDKYLIVATTRPETLLGDMAVAYSPKDDRYTNMKNDDLKLLVPFVDRTIPLIEDEYVKPEFGTGLVKITPLTDKNDYEVGLRHNLEQMRTIEKDGTISKFGTKYDGMDRFECRKIIIKDLKELNLVERIDDYENSIGECYRCHNLIESYLSNQWFIKMDSFREHAKKAEVELLPEYHKKIYFNWLDSDRDWCISRQIKWGHDIPIWYCSCGEVFCDIGKPTNCISCNSDKIYKEKSVLDTWFASSLWAHAVFNDPKELVYYYPTCVLVTGADILFFWVIRMIMMSKEMTDIVPFKKVYLHGVVRDGQGRKMSKSLGNGIDPLDIINKHSADILRFTLIFYAPKGEDVNISEESFEFGQRFCSKLWNSVRYILMNLDEHKNGFNKGITTDIEILKFKLSDIDRWILNKLNKIITKVTFLLEKFDFSEYVAVLNKFMRDDFCSLYLEYCKPYLYQESRVKISKEVTVSFPDNSKTPHSRKYSHHNISKNILLLVVDNILRLLHPIIPFITSELYDKVSKFKIDTEQINNKTKKQIINIMDSEYPTVINIDEYDDTMDSYLKIHKSIINKINNVRVEFGLNKNHVDIILDVKSIQLKNYLERNKKPILSLANVRKITYVNRSYENDGINDEENSSDEESDKQLSQCLKYELGFYTLYIKKNKHFDTSSKVKNLEIRKGQIENKIAKLTKFLKNKKTKFKKRLKFEAEIKNSIELITKIEIDINYYKNLIPVSD